MTKQLLIGILATLLTFGLFGTAAASSLLSPHGSEGGVHQFSFDTPETKADMAAKNHVYDSEKLAKVGTEGGIWEYDFNAPETKADMAARDYVYDQSTLRPDGRDTAIQNHRSVICSAC